MLVGETAMVGRIFAACGFGLALLALTGCGGSSGSTVTGSVTINGEPMKAGAITFMPVEAKGGQSAGGDIVNGKYTAKNVTPGKERVTVVVSTRVIAQQEMMNSEIRKIKELQHRGRRVSMPSGLVQLKQGSPGTGEIHEIGRGSQTLDLACEARK